MSRMGKSWKKTDCFNRDLPVLSWQTVPAQTGTPLELADYKSAISEAMFKGTKRNVESEEDSVTRGAASKNVQVG